MRYAARLAIISCVVMGAAHAAEDHSAHQHQLMQPGKVKDAQHRDTNAAPQMPVDAAQPSSHEGHAGHQMPMSEADPHAEKAAAMEDSPTDSERAHVPPSPPQLVMEDMSNQRMIELMQMEDTAPVSKVLLDRLEWRDVDGADALAWDGEAWYGNDYNKAWFKTEGERIDGENEVRSELLWDRIVRRWWSAQAGVRHDVGEGPSRTWAAIGVQGLAPYWFEVEATLYVGDAGRTAARFQGEYELLLTQRLILQPEIEFDMYGKGDRENGIGSGLSDAQVALRLRYEIRREFAPYVGIVGSRQFGTTADLTRAASRDISDLQFVAGLRVWF